MIFFLQSRLCTDAYKAAYPLRYVIIEILADKKIFL